MFYCLFISDLFPSCLFISDLFPSCLFISCLFISCLFFYSIFELLYLSCHRLFCFTFGLLFSSLQHVSCRILSLRHLQPTGNTMKNILFPDSFRSASAAFTADSLPEYFLQFNRSLPAFLRQSVRSEERRVGKEC